MTPLLHLPVADPVRMPTSDIRHRTQLLTFRGQVRVIALSNITGATKVEKATHSCKWIHNVKFETPVKNLPKIIYIFKFKGTL